MLQSRADAPQADGPGGSELPAANALPPEPKREESHPHSLPYQRFHALFDSLFKVLFIFPSRYLFAIGLVPVLSLGWSLPPALGCIPKQPDSKTGPRHDVLAFPTTGLSPSRARLSTTTSGGKDDEMTRLQTTIRRRHAAEIKGLGSSRFTRRYWGNPG